MSDFDDMGEKWIWLFGMVMVFYMEASAYKGEDQVISKTHFQGGYANVAHDMVEIADDMTEDLAKSYIDFKRKDAGFLGKEELERVLIHKESLRRQAEQYKVNIDKVCKPVYESYPHHLSGFIYAPLNSYTIGANSTMRESSLYKDPKPTWEGMPYTVDYCYHTERFLKEAEKKTEIDDKILQAYQQAGTDANIEQQQLELIAKITYRNTAELGFIYAPFIASTKMFTDSIGLFSNAINSEEARTKTVERANNEKELGKGALANKNNMLTAAFRHTIESAPYIMLPGVDAFRNQISTLLKNFSEVATGFIENIPFIGGAASSIVGGVIGTISEVASFMIAAAIIEKIIVYLPVVAVISAALFVIAFYFISVFYYVLVSPFVLAYAFANNQNDIIKSYILRGVALAFKPLFIVLSIVTAIVAVDLISSLNNMLVVNQYDLFFAITNGGGGGIGTDVWLLFTKSMLLIASSIIGILAAFYFVFYGADLILKIFGFNEVGIDAQEVVGGQMENKTGKFNTPMA